MCTQPQFERTTTFEIQCICIIEHVVRVLSRRFEFVMLVCFQLITLMIGDNDFCSDICYRSDLRAVLRDHREDLMEALRILRDNLPRTIVNLIPPPSKSIKLMLLIIKSLKPISKHQLIILAII